MDRGADLMSKDDDLETESRLTRLETRMDGVAEVKRLAIWSVVLSALALGTRAVDIAQAFLKH